MKSRLWGAVCACVITLGFVPVANSVPLTFNEQLNMQTMLEATISLFTTIADAGNGTMDQDVVGSGAYSETGWSYSGGGVFDGMPLSINYAGSLTGTNGQDITVDFQGTGSLGEDPLQMWGSTIWYYDANDDEYYNYDFEQLTKIGANSLWGWVLGGETALGVAAGIAVGVGVGTLLPPAGVVAGVKTGVLATGALIGISAGAKSLLETTAPPKPAQPDPPPAPTGGEFVPNSGFIITAVNVDGTFGANDLSGGYTSSGNYSGGSFSSQIAVSAVPVPAAIWLFGSGLLGLFGILRRKSSVIA